ncbi:MAG: hypothetical protein Q8P46_00280 [Hyphomicrobiales bacterium]|nr:hypothetical protein [Hyphomicrobiales bacterium]
MVEKIQYTNGGAGNQWTTIDGVRYATWFAWGPNEPTVGEPTRYQPYRAPLWHGQPDIDCARIAKA